MGISRRIKRNALRKTYKKFSKQWRGVKRKQNEEHQEAILERFKAAIESGTPFEQAAKLAGELVKKDGLGKRPPFWYWLRIVAQNITQAKAAKPEDVKEFAEEVPDLSWDEEPTK